ncbi:MAG: hypothetical protein JW849_10130, partial [Phycisphaerae bacterium]|nr:hypothetical protein [Phycisphaerae bacterium]
MYTTQSKRARVSLRIPATVCDRIFWHDEKSRNSDTEFLRNREDGDDRKEEKNLLRFSGFCI